MAADTTSTSEGGGTGHEEEENLCYKLRSEKSSGGGGGGGEIAMLEWSPTMDVVAIAFADHSVSLIIYDSLM